MYQNNLYTACPICKSPVRLADRSYRTCNKCNVWIRANINAEELANSYRNSWDLPLTNLKHTGGTDLFLASQYVDQLMKSLDIKNLTGKRILDFGAGKGEMVEALLMKGALVHAYEPFGTAYLQNKGINVYRDLIQIQENNVYDGIINIDVIEHVNDPIESFRHMFSLLKPGGWLYTATPNNQSLNARLTGPRWREAQNPSHLCLFSKTGMELALNQSGFEKIERLNWVIDYSKNFVRLIINRILTQSLLDGELRYLSWKPD